MTMKRIEAPLYVREEAIDFVWKIKQIDGYL